MNPREQKTLEFGVADGSARDRRVQLGRVIRDLRLGSDAKLLTLLVYDQTAEGVGAAWEASDETALGHALGPECGKTKFHQTRRALTEAGILSVDKHRADGVLRRQYRIDWIGVYMVRGLPLPERLQGLEDFSATRKNRHAKKSPRENSCCENSPREKNEAESRSISAPAHAGARLSSCLVFLSSVDVDDKTRRQEITRKANELRAAIFAHRPYAKLDTETRRFVATVAAIAVMLGEEWADWIDYAVAATKQAKATIPGAYLRNTMRKALVEFAGFCASDAEAAAVMGQLLAAARPLAKPILARRKETVETEVAR